MLEGPIAMVLLALCVIVTTKVDDETGPLDVPTGETSVPLTGWTIVVV